MLGLQVCTAWLDSIYFWWDTKALGLQSKLDSVWQQSLTGVTPRTRGQELSPLARPLKPKTEAKLRLAGGEKNLFESLLRRRELSTFPNP